MEEAAEFVARYRLPQSDKRGADAYEDSFRKAVEAGAVEDATTPRAFGLLAAAVVNASYVDDACGCDARLCRNRVVQRGVTLPLQVPSLAPAARFGFARSASCASSRHSSSCRPSCSTCSST